MVGFLTRVVVRPYRKETTMAPKFELRRKAREFAQAPAQAIGLAIAALMVATFALLVALFRPGA